MSNGFIVRPLSGSVGGAPIRLDVSAVPGKVIHANPVDSGGNDLVKNVLIGNPNPNQITLLVQTQGPGIASPTVIRIDVPPTAEGTEVRLFYTPFMIAPGFTYRIAAHLQENNVAPYLYGYVERHTANPYAGYGGLITQSVQAMADIPANGWQTVPFEAGMITTPLNVVQDPGSNTLAVEVAGIWYVSIYLTLSFTRNTNTDRTLYMRAFDTQRNQPAFPDPYPMYVQNSAEQAFVAQVRPAEIPQDNLTSKWRIEVGGSLQAFEGIQLLKAGFSLVRVASL